MHFWTQIQVKHILKYENLSHEFNDLMAGLGLNFNLEHLNSSERQAYQNYFDQESVLWVERYFKNDIEFFNYQFE